MTRTSIRDASTSSPSLVWSLGALCVLCALAALACQPAPHDRVAATSAECQTCHMPEYLAASDPVHADALPTTCSVCHGTEAWSPSEFHHPWPLTGAHATAACSGCHTGKPPVYKGTSKLCVDCHRKDYQSSPYPGHQSFPTTCADCHSTKAWKPASAGVHPESRFPIASGAHKGIACATCHDQPGTTSQANTDCVQCHSRSKYDPKHREVGGYPSGTAPVNFCVRCHSDGRVHDD